MLRVQGVDVVQDGDQSTTDLMKCVSSISDLESQTDGVSTTNLTPDSFPDLDIRCNMTS